jgi:phosphate starvation-inducible PhoH-like protein
MAKPKKNVVPFYERPAIKPKSAKQKKYLNTLKHSVITLATGSSGTGKTYIPSVLAADALDDNRNPIEKIVICRPNEGPGKTIGFLKGTLEEKMMPWAAPILDSIAERWGGGIVGKRRVEDAVKRGEIELLPLEHARGKTFNNCYVIVDEAQNTDWESLKNLTLRVGLDTRLVICGDIAQKDISEGSGLDTLMWLEDQYETPWVSINFDIKDCVRSDVVKYNLRLYEEAGV